MTAFVKQGSNATVNIISTEADPNLSDWIMGVAEEYCDIPVKRSELFKGAGMSPSEFLDEWKSKGEAELRSWRSG